jgi:exosortase/archaeosortase family protein
VARHAEPDHSAALRRVRWGAASLLVTAGTVLLLFAKSWRGIETIMSAYAIHLVTGQTTIANPGKHLLILYKRTSVQSVFVLTGECSVAYLLGALLIGSAPLMLLRQLSPVRTAMATLLAASVLILGNVARLTAIGATVSKWGRDPGLTIAHTYLGSVLTVVATCAAGVGFAAVLLGWRRSGIG